MSQSKKIEIIEVGPRDGLQSQAKLLSLSDKLCFIELLAEAGFAEIEAGAFVSPKWVPQMSDSKAIFDELNQKNYSCLFSALVPNQKGWEMAQACRVKKIAVFTAASESFTQKNINCSIQESLNKFAPIVKQANDSHVLVRGYVSTAFFCPYERYIEPKQVLPVIQALFDMGVDEVSIGDTIGKAEPDHVKKFFKYIQNEVPTDKLAMHFHDTYQNALNNILVSLDYGITRFDSSAGGIGGCPYAPGASGNVSTNALVANLEKQGLITNIDQMKLKQASEFIQNCLQKI